jgi:hypothetical protein
MIKRLGQGHTKMAQTQTKIGTQITTIAFNLLKQNPDGIRYSDLVKRIRS